MQRNPVQMYNYYANTIQSLQQSASHWKSRFDELSAEMLAGRDRFQPTTDGQFQSNMNSLRTNIRTLALTVAKSLGVTQEKLRKELKGRMLSEVANEEALGGRGCKNAMLQSAIWNVLYRQLFSGPFQIYGEEGRQVFEVWSDLFGDGEEGKFANSLF
jgi:hypothetical protein